MKIQFEYTIQKDFVAVRSCKATKIVSEDVLRSEIEVGFGVNVKMFEICSAGLVAGLRASFGICFVCFDCF